MTTDALIHGFLIFTPFCVPGLLDRHSADFAGLGVPAVGPFAGFVVKTHRLALCIGALVPLRVVLMRRIGFGTSSAPWLGLNHVEAKVVSILVDAFQYRIAHCDLGILGAQNIRV